MNREGQSGCRLSTVFYVDKELPSVVRTGAADIGALQPKIKNHDSYFQKESPWSQKKLVHLFSSSSWVKRLRRQFKFLEYLQRGRQRWALSTLGFFFYHLCLFLPKISEKESRVGAYAPLSQKVRTNANRRWRGL